MNFLHARNVHSKNGSASSPFPCPGCLLDEEKRSITDTEPAGINEFQVCLDFCAVGLSQAVTDQHKVPRHSRLLKIPRGTRAAVEVRSQRAKVNNLGGHRQASVACCFLVALPSMRGPTSPAHMFIVVSRHFALPFLFHLTNLLLAAASGEQYCRGSRSAIYPDLLP